MGKSVKNHKVVKLSPENYIRQRARALPIYECLVNKGWQGSKMANVIISRKHVNGNVTVGSYLVDLLCLGVKDTAYAFNIPMFEYNAKFIRADSDCRMDFEKIDYSLAHNIIFAGFDFAAGIGFNPHPDFLKTTQFILNQDNDEVDLIDIECGDDEMPAVVMGDENRKECLKIIAQLDRLVGKGNYKVIDTIDYKDDEPEEAFEEYTPEQFEADKKAFKKGMKNLKKQQFDESINMPEVTFRLFYHFIGGELIDKEYARIGDDLDVEVWYKDIPDEFFGVPTDTIEDKDWLKSAMVKAFKSSENDGSDEGDRGLYADIMNAYPDVPAVGVLDLYLSSKDDFNGYLESIKQYQIKFPDYELFEIIYNYTNVSESKSLDKELLNSDLKICDYFNGRKTLYWIEMYHFVKLYTLHTLSQTDPIRIGALFDFLNEEYLPEEATQAGRLLGLIFMMDCVDESIGNKSNGVLNRIKRIVTKN